MDTAVNSQTSMKKNKDLIIYPMSQFGQGMTSAFFPTYVSALMSMIYVFPIAMVGILDTVSVAMSFFAQPLSGVIMDRFNFKKAQFWPWIIIGSMTMVILWIILYTLPIIVAAPASLAGLVLVMRCLMAVLDGPSAMAYNKMFALLAKDGKTRSYLTMTGKVCRDGLKVIIGFAFPVALAALISTGMEEVRAWAYFAIILGGASFIVQIIYCVMTKNSQVEKDAVAQGRVMKSKPQPISKTFIAIFTNRNLVGVFCAQTLSKVFYFYHVMGGMFFWRYYMENMRMLAAYMTALSIAAVVGAMIGLPIFLKVFKDTKRCAVAAFVAQAVMYAIAYFMVGPSNVMGSIAIICAASFFNGMSDSFLMPLFAHGADYSAWKSGNKDYGMNMAIFGLAIRTGGFFSASTRAAFLAAGGFVSAELTPAAMAAGAKVPDSVKIAIHNTNTLYPFFMCIAIILILIFVYNLSDKKVAEIQKEIAERDAAIAAAAGKA